MRQLLADNKAVESRVPDISVQFYLHGREGFLEELYDVMQVVRSPEYEGGADKAKCSEDYTVARLFLLLDSSEILGDWDKVKPVLAMIDRFETEFSVLSEEQKQELSRIRAQETPIEDVALAVMRGPQTLRQ